MTTLAMDLTSTEKKQLSLFSEDGVKLIKYIQTTPESVAKWDHISNKFGLELYDEIFMNYANSKPDHPRKWETVGRYFLMSADQAHHYYNDILTRHDDDIGFRTDTDEDFFSDDEEMHTQDFDENESDCDSFSD